MKRVVVVGAGMTGLACAWALRDRADVVVLEAGARVGGNVRTERERGFVMDAGPDAWLVTKPQATALAREAGLGDELIGTIPENRRVYVAWNSRLYPMPEGVVLGVPTRIAPMVTTRLFSLAGKARMGLEPFVRRRTFEGDEDESVGDFIERRLGREANERLAAPLLGGIFAGDAKKLSVRAAFPQLVEQESEYGSLIRAMRAVRKQRASKGAAQPSAFQSLSSGMSRLPTALAAKLHVKLGVRVERIARAGAAYEVSTSGGPIACDVVVLATPPRATSALLVSIDEEASRVVDEVRCGSSAAIFLGYKREDVAHPLDATGFVVPRGDGTQSLTACTFVTSKWEGRAPEGHVLLRAFVGGAGREAALDASDEALVTLARREVGALLGSLGEPVMARVFRHVNASPQPEVGHLTRMRLLGARLATHRGLYVIGNGYAGTGIPDCIKQARAVAAAILA